MVSCSTSVVSEDQVTGSHVPQIECFSATKGLGINESIDSKPFCVGGHSWVIRYYPDGRSDSDKDWIAVDLRLDRPASPGEVVRARFEFSLVDQKGSPFVPSYCFHSDKTGSFSIGGSRAWGFHKFIKRKRCLEKSNYFSGDCLRIKCEVTVVEFGVRTQGTKRRRITGEMWYSKIGDELFPAHRSVLAARSSVFDAEFFGPMKEKTDGHIRIEDVEANVFKVLLDFMYTDSLPAMDEGEEIVVAQHLLVAADRYDLKRLKLMCEDKLCNHIDIGTVATTMALAEQHSCQGLRESCFEFLSIPDNLKKIKATDGYQHLKASCPSFLEELVDKFAT
ncbi:unnamed protein product [Urochloa decumbens]|uniref:Uncharacterized protein n=1 Tax=Urochloa decumbens TaxID=240449 RepID=A0ABC9ALQ4_9POAL